MIRSTILISYHYFQKSDLDKWLSQYTVKPLVFADSGAYSAMTQGAPIQINEYAAWIKRWSHWFEVYANLDVIMNGEATWRNQQYLEDRHGLQPLPVFHVNEEWSWLERYVDRYPYMALGVAGMQQNKGVWPWLIRAFKIAGKQTVFHGFALTTWQVMRAFPWYSVDSSSWGRGFRFGSMPIFDHHKGRFVTVKTDNVASCKRHQKVFQQLGFNWIHFADPAVEKRSLICKISGVSYKYAEDWIKTNQGPVSCPGRVDGIHMFLADTNKSNFQALGKGLGERFGQENSA